MQASVKAVVRVETKAHPGNGMIAPDPLGLYISATFWSSSSLRPTMYTFAPVTASAVCDVQHDNAFRVWMFDAGSTRRCERLGMTLTLRDHQSDTSSTASNDGYQPIYAEEVAR